MLLRDFVRESNFIEGIIREPTVSEIHAHERFLTAPVISLEVLENFVNSIQPDAVLRRQPGLNVMVGSYYPLSGGPQIIVALADTL